jgi:hypothetical protein
VRSNDHPEYVDAILEQLSDMLLHPKPGFPLK